MVDLNRRIGNVNGGFECCLEKFGEMLRNRNGERIIEFCIENELVNTQRNI